jgi:hypothetical protein
MIQMRKLKKSELKRVYGAGPGWGRGGNPDKTSDVSEATGGSVTTAPSVT